MDFHHRMIRACAGMIADRALRDGAQDCRRAARALADLGAALAESEQANRVFGTLCSELERPCSPLYRLLCAALNQTDPDSLKAFAVNLGGSQLYWGTPLRARKSRALGAPIPGMVVFDGLPLPIGKLIMQANQMGIYLFVLSQFSFEQAARTARTHPESAFLHLISRPPAPGSPDTQPANLCFLAEMAGTLPESTLTLLCESRRLFGLLCSAPPSPAQARRAFAQGCLFAAAPSGGLWNGPLPILSPESLRPFLSAPPTHLAGVVPAGYQGSLEELLVPSRCGSQ